MSMPHMGNRLERHFFLHSRSELPAVANKHSTVQGIEPLGV